MHPLGNSTSVGLSPPDTFWIWLTLLCTDCRYSTTLQKMQASQYGLLTEQAQQCRQLAAKGAKGWVAVRCACDAGVIELEA